MIEFYHTYSNSKMSYAEAVLYCFALGDGWCLPTEQEYNSEKYERVVKSFCILHCTWHFDDPFKTEEMEYYALPVRDTEDTEIFKKVLDSISQIKYNNYVN